MKKLIMWLLVGVACFSVPIHIYLRPVTLKNYCLEDIIGQSFEQVQQAIKDNGYYVHNDLNESEIEINNHASPFFRMSCWVVLESGIVKKS